MADFFFNWLLLPLDSMLRLATVLIFCALAGLFSERSGVVNIALEGKLLFAAFCAAATASVTANAWLGLGAGILGAVLLALLHGFATITHRGNQIVSGMAINILVAGLTVILARYWFELGGQTPNLPNEARFMPLTLPFAEALKELPLLGVIYHELISGHSLLSYMALLCVPLSAWILYQTRFGLRLRAVGENPTAVDTAGISVTWLRYRAVLMSGLLCGFAGVYLSMGGSSAGFVPNMSAGNGYIALAALIFGKWRPYLALLGCLLFGLLQAFAIRLQGVELPLLGTVPVQFIEIVPYVITVVLLAGVVGRAQAPKAIGIPYMKERE